MNVKILFVDDEPNILFAYRRQLKREFQLETALGPEEALTVFKSRGPYAVVVSDLRMPGMDGIHFLSRIRELSPDTVRIMITGYADLDAAMSAVNEGNIFRFLTKPVDRDLLVKNLMTALEQYQLVTAERELLEKTLNGSIRVLTEVLSLVNPIAFSCAFRLKRYAKHILNKLDIKNGWQIEIAAMLSQIGCITLHPETIEKVYAGQELSEEEMEAYNSHPKAGCELLVKIPRLENVSHIIEKQREPGQKLGYGRKPEERNIITLGAQILRVVTEFDRFVVHGTSHKVALAQLRVIPEEFDPALVGLLDDLELTPSRTKARTVPVRDLNIGMILDQDVMTTGGVLLVAKGQEVTGSVNERLRRFAHKNEVDEPIRVLVPCVKKRGRTKKTPEPCESGQS